MKALEGMVVPVLNPGGDAGREAVLATVLARYGGRRWKGSSYLAHGLYEHRRIAGCLPGRHPMAAWLYHAWEPGDEGMSSVAFLRDCRSLGFSLEEAERHVVPLISGCWDLTGGASVVIDMELSFYGQPRVAYLRSARRARDRWRHLGSRVWEEGRALGLVMLVQKDPMFQSPEFERELAEKARGNIKAELLLLGMDYDRERAEADKAAAEAKEKKDEVPAQRPDSAPAGKQGEDTGPVPGGGEGGGEVRVPPGGKP
jgi:hypothetical protein